MCIRDRNHPDRYTSISAFAPIASPTRCPWGHKALGNYIGEDRSAWEAYDASLLLEKGSDKPILIDQGEADNFLGEQLKPELLEAVLKGNDQTLRRQPGYDHSYYFIASFIGEHIDFHARHLLT